MDFDKSFKLTSLLLLLSGFIPLWASGAIGLVDGSLYLLATLVSWKSKWVRPRWNRFAIFPVLILGYLADALVFTDVVTATVHALMVASLFKLFSTTVKRDHLFFCLVSLGFLLFALTHKISILFLSSVVFYMFCLTLTFVLLQSKKPYEENPGAPFSMQSCVNVTFVITGLIILISAPIFVAIPRASFSLFSVNRRLGLNVAGFSDQVKLGDMGEIISGSNILMRVKVGTSLKNLPSNLKWRGVALDHYSGRQWSRTRSRFRKIQSNPRGRLRVSQDHRSSKSLVKQTFFLEPFSDFIFGAPNVVSIAGNVLRQGPIFDDGHGSIVFYRTGHGLTKYVVYSDLIRRSKRLSKPIQGSIPRLIQRKYLQLPVLHPDIEKLASSVTMRQESSLNKALKLENFLRHNYGYSLANISAKAEDPLKDFLFVTKTGHCEFFATSQAVMMRILGIPARIVNGFRPGEFNDLSGYFTVRESDAHSWVEGYFPGPGWVEFDPTPALNMNDTAFFLSIFCSQVLDVMDMFLTDLVTFDRIKQAGLFDPLEQSIRNTRMNFSVAVLKLADLTRFRWEGRLQEWDFTWIIYVACGCVVLLGVFFAYRYRRYFRVFWKRCVLKDRSSEIASEYYLEMLDILRHRGFLKHLSETPAEFVKRVQADFSSSIPVQITQLYYRHRFGSFPLGKGELSRIHAYLRKLAVVCSR